MERAKQPQHKPTKDSRGSAPGSHLGPAPAPALNALSPSDILQLQRTIGNKAVQRLLQAQRKEQGSTPPPATAPLVQPGPALSIDFVQRKVGFEFEADAWFSYLVERRMTPQEQQIKDQDRSAINLTATTAGGFTKPPKKGHVIQSIGGGTRPGPGPGFELQADEKDADHGDLEFVTKPFEETQQGYDDLKSTLEMMRSLMNFLVSLPIRNKTGSYIWPDEHKLDYNLLLSLGDRPMKLKPQVTGGIGLDKISSVMENMGVVPGESPVEANKRKDGRGSLLAANTTMAKILGSAPGMARNAIQHYLPQRLVNWALVQNDFQDTNALQGLVSMAVAYVKAGVNVTFASYPKVLAPLMSRTEFSTLFGLLPAPQQNALRSDPKVFCDLVLAAANSNIGITSKDVALVDTMPLIQHFGKAGMDDIKQLTIGRWLDGIPRGVDYLSVSGFQQMLHEDRGTPGALTQQQMAVSEELEGFGALGSKTDSGNAIVEFRGIPTMLDHTQIEEFALNFHKYIVNLNTKPRGSVYYGKQ